MIMEDFMTFDLAVELKEKGFNIPFYFFYRTDDKLLHHAHITNPLEYGDKVDDEVIIAPTISQVLKWLREKHFIHISTKPYPCEDGLMWLYEIRRFNEHTIFVIANRTGFVKEEQAAIAGIEYTINLI